MSVARPAASTLQPPMVVDLDGTLIYSDLLWESLLLFLRQQFWHAWLLPLWLLKGKAGFKQALAARVTLNPATLPYDQGLLRELAQLRTQGRQIVLATGAERRFAEAVAAHTGLFDRVLATENGINLTSSNKAVALCRLFGERNFDYVGNARADLAVWAVCRQAYAVTATPFELGDGRQTAAMGSRRKSIQLALFKAIRPRQWLKNLLVFVPMVAAHALTGTHIVQSIIAFIAFSLCASSAYLLNDALDAHDDRLHPTKRRRPIADGSLPLSVAMLTSPLLALVSLVWCASTNLLLAAMVLSYFLCTLAYSLLLKRLLMIDIVALAILYTLRILGGSAATGIEPSFWLLAFSFFIFLSLALLKRYSELFNLHRQGKDKTSGRGYTTADKTPISMMGVNSAFLSVLIFMLYFNSQTVRIMYRHPHLLLAIVPLLVFWLGRIWTLAFRGEVNEDPVLYVSKDKVSLIVLGLCLLLALAAVHLP